MKRFWKWIEKKGYGIAEEPLLYVNNTFSMEVDLRKQMLIGYMIEYLLSNKIHIKDMVPLHLPLDIDGVYNWLRSKIEGIK